MSLSDRCASSFSESTREDGLDCFYDGLIHIHSKGKDYLLAEAQGSELYDVELELVRKAGSSELLARCSCPHFDAGNLCEHIWALIEEADERGWARQAAKEGPVSVVWSGWDLDDLNDDISDEDLEDEEDEDQVSPRRKEPTKAALQPRVVATAASSSLPDWKLIFSSTQKKSKALRSGPLDRPGSKSATTRVREIRYGLTIEASLESSTVTIGLFQREIRANGDWGVLKPLKLDHADLATLAGAVEDQRLLALLLGGKTLSSTSYGAYYPQYMMQKVNTFRVSEHLAEILLPALAQTGRLSLFCQGQERPSEIPLGYDGDGAWEFTLVLEPEPSEKGGWILQPRLQRRGVTIPLTQPNTLIGGRFAVVGDQIIQLVPILAHHRPWIAALAQQGGAQVPERDLDKLIESVAEDSSLPPVILPREIQWREEIASPTPRLSIMAASASKQVGSLIAHVVYDYSGTLFMRKDPGRFRADKDARVLRYRNAEAEAAFILTLSNIPDVALDPPHGSDKAADVAFPVAMLGVLTDQLTALGWIVEAEGRPVRRAGAFKSFVSSGVDWFDLDASCQFGEQTVALPALLAALRNGEQYVRLDDGTVGLLPFEWLKKFNEVAEIGAPREGKVRFSRAQITLLDTLVDELPELSFDERFRELRDRIKAFSGVRSSEPGAGFAGVLREYQSDGLGWLEFLADFGFGGCLADDMGLGKTIQVLAMLQKRVAQHKRPPSLVVVPRSLVHNWRDEAQRFVPTLRVLDFASSERHQKWDEIPEHDVVLTTYAMLRSDVERLRNIQFDYCVLDEAQAIKNSASQVAKAARLVKAENRLAMSGTPVENHLGELGSIFEFLNPGMLLPALLAEVCKRDPSESKGTVERLAKALRPFILRRTKEQVLKDLPAKTEQTIHCELDREQRKLYDDLRNHYRARLTKTIKEKGIARSKIQVLEALMRLRQAACHPGLIDKSRASKSSAKLEALLEQLDEVMQSGHKALVFSQFTSMLALVKARLDANKISYEYLDGRTRDRKSKVERFQTDPYVKLFLISLKAGGVGLNLTAADYCFILDPWWNPAAEAQAIDRAHRIGQTKRVFAYRLIARDTVEEKILALQEKKRDLAKAIVSAENSAIRSLSLDDVEQLFS